MKTGALPRDVIARAVPHVHRPGRVFGDLELQQKRIRKGYRFNSPTPGKT